MTIVSPVTLAGQTLRDAERVDRPASQRQLVARSLLRCPDAHPSPDR
jgi:hypothetical protein